MKRKRHSKIDLNPYWENPETPFPMRINWKVMAPKGAKLSTAQDHDIAFDNYDLKIRGIT